MKFLPFPENSGDTPILKQCKKPEWSHREAMWLEAAARYRRYRGNPWMVFPANFSKEDADALRDLYTSQGYNAPINEIRRPDTPPPSCPLCGSLAGRSLDHALPRKHFPEFSILRENLVPACACCNSSEKRDIYRGENLERFIHPYYDNWIDQELWYANLIIEDGVLKFTAEALPHLTYKKRIIVNFHVKTLLGKDWKDSVRRIWGSLPGTLMIRLGNKVTEEEIKTEIEIKLKESIVSNGINNWYAGFYRGLLKNKFAIKYLKEKMIDIQ